MKKIWLIIISLIAIGLLFVIYQQHQLIRDYRGLMYGEMAKINIPIERLLEFHEEAEDYNEEERDERINHLLEIHRDFFNHTGGGLQLESEIRKNYYETYFDTKSEYTDIFLRYKDAASPEEREQAYQDLQEIYDQYNEFLKTAEEELVEPI